MKRYGIIYKITNLINGKVYIGQTIEKDGFNGRYKRSGKGIERVYKYHKYCETNKPKSCNIHLLRSIEKYGLDAFEVIEEFDIAYSKEELDYLEDKYIKEFDCINNGYNHKGGGSHGSPMEGKTEEEINEWKEKLRQANLGDKNPMYRKEVSLETRKKLSEATSGENNPMFGAIRDDMKGDLNPMKNPEIVELFKGKNSPVATSVICLTTGKIFDTLTEAGKFYNIKSYNHIATVCRGRRKYCGKLPDGTKLEWMYYEDYLKQTA